MKANRADTIRYYERCYERDNYFGYSPWVYQTYLSALVRRARLEREASVLDVGCGQGLFTALFSKLGFSAVGLDITETGIASASRKYEGSGATFVVGDLHHAPFDHGFDCVFTRSCSLYNMQGFPGSRETTDALLKLVKPGGVFIFQYNTRLRQEPADAGWIHHSAEDLRRHFSAYPGAVTYLSIRMNALLLGPLAFTAKVSWISERLAELFGVGVELVAIVPKRM